MRDKAFFEQLEHVEFPWRDGSMYVPGFYYDTTTINVAFLTPLAKVQALLPSPRLKPVRATPWHALTSITAYEYRDSDVGPYNEVSIGFPVTLDRAAPVGVQLFRPPAGGMWVYVHSLPVTTQIAFDAGVDFFNFPKFLAHIEFEREQGWLRCRVAEGDRHILTLSARQLPVSPGGRSRIHALTVRKERILRCEIVINARQAGASRSPADVRLELGDHALADDLRGLNLGRMLSYSYVPENQSVLSCALESFPIQ